MSHTHQWWNNYRWSDSMSRRGVKACVDVSLLHGLDLVVMVDVDPERHHSTPCSNGPRYIVPPPLNCDSTTAFLKIHLTSSALAVYLTATSPEARFSLLCSSAASHIAGCAWKRSAGKGAG